MVVKKNGPSNDHSFAHFFQPKSAKNTKKISSQLRTFTQVPYENEFPPVMASAGNKSSAVPPANWYLM